METKSCPVCGQEFEGRSNKIYCSEKCKKEAFLSKQENESKSNYSPTKKQVPESDLVAKEKIRLEQHKVDLEYQDKKEQRIAEREKFIIENQQAKDMEQLREKTKSQEKNEKMLYEIVEKLKSDATEKQKRIEMMLQREYQILHKKFVRFVKIFMVKDETIFDKNDHNLFLEEMTTLADELNESEAVNELDDDLEIMDEIADVMDELKTKIENSFFGQKTLSLTEEFCNKLKESIE